MLDHRSTRALLTPSKLALDIALFVSFLLAMDPRLTGISIHEWLSLALTAAIVCHLLLSWRWIVDTTRRFLRNIIWPSRLNWLLGAVLFVDFTLIVFTGLVMSEAVLPAFGIRPPLDPLWRRLHSLTADFGLIVLGFHLAFNWDWIAKMLGRYVGRPAVRLLPGHAAVRDEA